MRLIVCCFIVFYPVRLCCISKSRGTGKFPEHFKQCIAVCGRRSRLRGSDIDRADGLSVQCVCQGADDVPLVYRCCDCFRESQLFSMLAVSTGSKNKVENSLHRKVKAYRTAHRIRIGLGAAAFQYRDKCRIHYIRNSAALRHLKTGLTVGSSHDNGN